jgi:aryl-alcohol dehydrogenase-like predicted oxidoreductase
VVPRRQLGSQGFTVSAIGLGCVSMTGFYGARNDEESEATIYRALDMGVDLFDTSDMYGNGENEEFIGKAIHGRRGQVQIATKFGRMLASDGKFAGVNGRPEYVKSACEQSLRRLGVDVIDLYYQHRVDPDTPIEETIGAMAELVKEGKVRFIGLCEVSASTIRRAHAIHPLKAIQSEYSLWSRDAESEVLPTCQELGIGFVAYSPLGRGFLTGTIRSLDNIPENDYRRHQPRFQGRNFENNLSLLRRIEEIAAEKDCTPSQLALAWVLKQGEHIVPIAGTKRRTYLDENMGTFDVNLTDDDVRRINDLFPPGVFHGERYPESSMRYVNL